MKFAHLADCHLGSWSNHPDMREYPMAAFESTLEKCIHERVDFIIIAGDLFDTSLPSIDVLKRTAGAFRKCKEAGVAVYAIPGSHDFSPTGKTMISVLEEAGLLVDVCKLIEDEGKITLVLTEDKKTGTKLAGVMGRKGGLDANYYKNIAPVREEGTKIFVFHAALAEHKPDNMREMLAVSVDDLPKGFDYYATGHVHQQFFDKIRNIVFPGELFPTSFDELEKYNGSYVVASYENGKIGVEWRTNRLFDVALMCFDVTGKTPAFVESEIIARIEKEKLEKKALLLKLSGTLEAGRVSDINFKDVNARAEEKGAIIVKRNISGVKIKEFEEIASKQYSSAEEIERSIIKEHAGQLKISGISDIEAFVVNLMDALKEEKREDETNALFEERVKSSARTVVGI